MSGLAGIASSTACSPVSELRASLDPLLSALAHRGSPEVFASPEFCVAAFSHAGSGFATQTLHDEESGCILTWDGRLDNGRELIRTLSLSNARDLTDAAVALAAWKKWQDGSPAHLMGDFAFTVWDARCRSLFAARDVLGLRPFFYSQLAGKLIFASEVRALLEFPGVDRQVDDVMASEFLLWWSAYPDLDRTFFRGIRRLPPAHWIRWNNRGLQSSRYWQLDPQRRIAYARREEYAEEFFPLLREAVHCRQRGARMSGVMLSGGFDSGAVAAVAAQTGGGGEVRAYTGRCGTIADETAIASGVSRHAGIAHRILEMEPAGFGPWIAEMIARQASPIADAGSRNDGLLLQAAREDGCRFLLTGDGADELFGSPPHYVADLLRSARLMELARHVGGLARYNGQSARQMLRAAAGSLLPGAAAWPWRRLKWTTPPAWISRELAARTRLLSRLRASPKKLRLPSISGKQDYFAFVRGRRVWMDEAREIEAAHRGMHFRYPFYDRRLVEFMFAIPWDVKVSGSRGKIFLRDAPGLLPATLRNLREKGGASEPWRPSLSTESWQATRGLFHAELPQLHAFLDADYFRRFSAELQPGLTGAGLVTFWGLARFLLWQQRFAAATLTA